MRKKPQRSLKDNRHLILDFDGTVYQNEELLRDHFAREGQSYLAKELGLNPEEAKLLMNEASERVDGVDFLSSSDFISEKYQSFDPEDFHRTIFANFPEGIRNHLTSDFLEDISETYEVSFFTNNSRHAVSGYLEDIDMDVNTIIGFESLEELKPSSSSYDVFLEKSNSDPEECIMVEDRKRNLEIAEKLGMNTVLIGYSQEAYIDLCLNHLRDVGDYL